jgi:pantothenate synthetase
VKELELLESIGWIALGFVPTYIVLHLGYDSLIRKSKEKIEAIAHKQR